MHLSHSYKAVTLLGLAVVIAPLRRGGVDWPIDVACALVACAVVLMGSLHAERPWTSSRPRLGVSWLEVALLCVALLVALQLVPFSPALIHRVSPSADDVFRRALEPIGLYPASRPLSLDPGSTARELCKIAAWTLAFAASALLTRRLRGDHVLLGFVAAAGAGVGLLAVGASVTGAGALVESRAVFVNPNHLAGLLNLCAWPAMGFALRSRGVPRVAWFAAFAVCTLEVFLSLSRGGVAAFCAGGMIFSLLMARRPRRETRSGRLAALAPFLVAGVVVVVASVLAFSPLVATFRTVSGAPDEAKFAMWPVAMRMTRDFPAVGIGRGAYLTTYPSYEREPAPFTFTHVENEWLQVPLELGLPGGLLLLGVFAWSWVTAASRRSHTRPVIGALAGSAALVLQNAVDFSLELTGVALPFAVTMGVLSWRQREVHVSPWFLRASAVLVAALGLTGMALHRLHALDRDVARLEAAAGKADVLEAAREALRWHPADYVAPATAGGWLAAAGECREALPWLVRAMDRKPTAPEPHRFAARCLSASGPGSPAGTEYRLAFLLGDRDAMREAAQRYTDPGALLAIAPQTVDGLIAAGDVAPDPHDAVTAYQAAWDLSSDPMALARLARATLAVGNADSALELARRLQRISPKDPDGFEIAAAALTASERLEDATAELEEGVNRLPGEERILVPLGQVLAKRKMYPEARRALEQIVVRTDRELVAKHLYLGSVMEQAGQYTGAIQEYEASHRAVAADSRPLDALARIMHRLRRHDEELRYLEDAAARPGVDRAKYEARIARVRQELQADSNARARPPGSSTLDTGQHGEVSAGTLQDGDITVAPAP